jgi:hypothetical protein
VITGKLIHWAQVEKSLHGKTMPQKKQKKQKNRRVSCECISLGGGGDIFHPTTQNGSRKTPSTSQGPWGMA